MIWVQGFGIAVFIFTVVAHLYNLIKTVTPYKKRWGEYRRKQFFAEYPCLVNTETKK